VKETKKFPCLYHFQDR